MTRISTIILLPLALLLGACDREETDNAEPNEVAVEGADDKAHGRGHGRLKKLDTDGDGMISLAEARDSRIADKFAELDLDRDGKLSKDELRAMKGKHRGEGHDKGHGWKGKDPAERAAHFMAKFDADKDGALSSAEVAEHPRLAGKFAELDADRDGKLVTAELAAMKGGKHGEGHGKGHGWKDKDPAERAAHFMAKFDANKDGALSSAELAEHPRLAEKFAEIDSDKDGKLSAAEVTAFKADHHGKGHDKGRGRGHDKGRGRGHDGDRGGPQAAG